MRETAITTAFVGVLRPDGDGDTNPAFSQAGQLFQERLLATVADAGLNVTAVFSQRPIPSFPAGRLWVRGRMGTVADRFRARFLPFVNFGPLKTICISVALFGRLLEWGWRHRLEQHRVLLLYNIAAPPGIVSITAARLISASVFAVIADVQIPGSGLVRDSFFRRVEFRLQQWTIPRCGGLIVLTENIAHDFAPGLAHICVEGAIPDVLPSDESLPRPAASRTADVRDGAANPVILMYAGGLSELKGIPLLLAAMKQLESSDYRLWVTGDGPLRSSVEAAAATDSRVTYWGFSPYAEVLSLMAKATVLINPHSTTHKSARYVFPSKLIEYLATGKPVISTASVPEVKEQYGHVMFVVQEATPEALATQIRHVAALSRRDLSLMGARARSYVLARKSWSMQGRRIAEFVRDNVSR